MLPAPQKVAGVPVGLPGRRLPLGGVVALLVKIGGVTGSCKGRSGLRRGL